MKGAPDVVHDQVHAEARQLERLGPAETPAGAGDDGHLAVHAVRVHPLTAPRSPAREWNTF
jgi:hypothetical protein